MRRSGSCWSNVYGAILLAGGGLPSPPEFMLVVEARDSGREPLRFEFEADLGRLLLIVAIVMRCRHAQVWVAGEGDVSINKLSVNTGATDDIKMRKMQQLRAVLLKQC